jgi:hypothetical protein
MYHNSFRASPQDAAVKTGGHYTLKIVHDEDDANPREDYDNFGHMACWHSRYNLGDKHDHENPGDLMKNLVRQTIPDKDLIAIVKDGKADGLTLEYDKSGREWELKSYDGYFKKWYVEWSSPPPLDDKGYGLADSIRECLSDKDLMSLTERNHLIMPLYLLDNSGIAISTRDFHDRWDSGQVGWTYASYAEVAKEYGDASPENIERARGLLNSEAETYDYYLRGECYGFQLFRDGVEEDSCWGFLGSFDEAKKAIREYIPEDAAALADDAEYGDNDPENDPEDDMEQGDDDG